MDQHRRKVEEQIHAIEKVSFQSFRCWRPMNMDAPPPFLQPTRAAADRERGVVHPLPKVKPTLAAADREREVVHPLPEAAGTGGAAIALGGAAIDRA